METSLRSRLVTAAFELFEERGFESTTVDDIAERAGAGRATFFRQFRTKQDVIFPDHNELLPQVEARLATGTPSTRDAALREAARIVLDHYVGEGEVARARYRLTQKVPALSEREAATIQRYLHLLTRYTREWMAAEPSWDLDAELLASAVITAHNHVLREWLAGRSEDVGAGLRLGHHPRVQPIPRRPLPRRNGRRSLKNRIHRRDIGAGEIRTNVTVNCGGTVESSLRPQRCWSPTPAVEPAYPGSAPPSARSG